MSLKKFLTTLIAFSLMAVPTQITVLNVEAAEEVEISIWDGSTDVFWYNDHEDVFSISTPEELSGLAKLVNAGNSFEGKTINLENDIYLNDISNISDWYENSPENIWIPIGVDFDHPFSGMFNGQGNRIIGLYTEYSNYASRMGGLIGYATEEVNILNLTTDKGLAKGYENVGAIVAYAPGAKISNCKNYCDVLCEYSVINCYQTYAGGISGYGGIIEKCTNYGNIKSDFSSPSRIASSTLFSQSRAGGITSVGSISNCSNYGTVEAICIDFTNNYSQVRFYFDSYAGGIAATSSSIINCYNYGKVISSGGISYTGGIVGTSSGTIKSSYNVGELVFKTSEEQDRNYGSIGGIIGCCQKEDELILSNSYYLNTTADKGIGNSTSDNTFNVNEKTMKTEKFAQALGEAFVYVEGDYPKLVWEVDLKGDINEDGSVNIADAVMLQRFLLGNGTLTNWKNADLCEDETIDVFDMVLMRRLLLKKFE